MIIYLYFKRNIKIKKKKGGMEVDWVLSILLFFTLIMFSFFYISHLFNARSLSTQYDLKTIWEKTKEEIYTNATAKMYEVSTKPKCILPYVLYEPQKLIAYDNKCDSSLLIYGNQSHYFSYHLFLINDNSCLLYLPSPYYESLFLPNYNNDISLTSTQLSNSYTKVQYNNTCITQLYYKETYLNNPICFNKLYEAKILPYGAVLNYANNTFVFIPSYSKTLIFLSNTTRDWVFILDKEYTHYYDATTNSTIPSTYLFYSLTPPFLSLYNENKSITFYSNNSIEAYNESDDIKIIVRSTDNVYIHLDNGYVSSFYSCILGGIEISYGKEESVLNENKKKYETEYKYNLTIPSLSKSWGYRLPSVGDIYSKGIYIRVVVDNSSIYYTRGVLRVWRESR